MSRYTDVDALKKTIDKEIFRHDTIDHVFQIIDDAPSIEIIRCGECKWNASDGCFFSTTDRTLDDFCSYGSRSEKPNNSTISKMEQVETMSCAECKHRPIGAEICEEPCHYEPQTDWHYDEQDATWYPYKHEDEPQQKSCATCKHALGNWDGESNNCGRCCGADRRFYEPKDEPQTERSSE